MNIIYHFPLPLDPNAKSASGIRPMKILEAFKSLGYTVEVISGYAFERKKQIQSIKQKISSGIKYEFCYSESSTMPTQLTEKNHFPVFISPDFNFFKFCKRNSIPVKLFYRDIYWCFADYYKQVGFKGYIAKFFYKYDVKQYLKYLDTLYVPCFEMLKYIPKLKKLHCEELPSGCVIIDTKLSQIKNRASIYVGGIGNHYNLHKLISVFSKFKNEKLILCVRKEDWDVVKDSYIIPDNVQIVHATGEGLNNIYSISNKSMLFLEPSVYWEFAIPYKLFEYIGRGLPVIATEGTAVGKYVKKMGIGWTISYTEEALKNLLIRLYENPDELTEKMERIKIVASENTWQKRCEQIARK